MRLTGIFVCFFFSWANAQNLIPNPSLEEENVCELVIPCSPNAWYSVANMPYGYENKFTHHVHGTRAISFLIALKTDIRTYWQVPLLADIKKGKNYRLHFYLYSPEKKISNDLFGNYFSNTFFRSWKDKIIQVSNFLKISDSSIQPLKNDWMEISIDFEASEDAKYMLMGNLSAISNHEILKAYGKKTEVIEYFVDDISLTAIEPLTSEEKLNIMKRSDSLNLSNFRHKFLKEPAVVMASKSNPPDMPVIKTDTLRLGKINFKFDSYELLNKEMIRDYFEKTGIKTISGIDITGYTDSVGNIAYNQLLSENRAIAVKKFLTDSLLISSGKIKTVGKGKTNDNKLQEENRRVEMVIYRKE